MTRNRCAAEAKGTTRGIRKARAILAGAVVLAAAPLAHAVDPNPLENAYWRFEEGTPGNAVNPANANAVTDSANANHMRTASNGESAPVYSSTISAPIVPQTGLPNAVSMQFGGGNRDIYSELKHINHPIINNGFTLETSFLLDTVGGAFQCIVGKDGKPSGSSPLATLELKCRGDDGTLQIELIDGSGTPRDVRSTAALTPGQWYHAAVVNTGTALSLYLDDGEGAGYVLQGQTALSGGALADIDRPWTIGRGTFNDANADWMAGTVQEVRLSNTALDPGKFLFTPANSKWIVDADGGNWSALSSWQDGGSPRVAGATANFTDGINAARTVNVDVPVTLGTLNFDNSTHAYTLAGAMPITLEMPGVSQAAVNVLSGSHALHVPLVLAHDATIFVNNAADVLALSAGVSAPANIALTKTGLGTLVAKEIVVGLLNVNEGTVRITPDGGPDGVSVVDVLNVIGPGRLDLTNNKLVTESAVGSWSGSAYDGVSGKIQSGRNDGTWTGAGIVTSQTDAMNSSRTSIGVASASQVKGIGSAATGVWAGQTVSGSDTLVMYTYGGDANLDGQINIDDYGHIDTSVGVGLKGWFNGDFNYDGVINIDDYGIIDVNVGVQGAPFSTELAATAPVARPEGVTAAVPEPAAFSSVILLSLATFRRGGRRHK